MGLLSFFRRDKPAAAANADAGDAVQAARTRARHRLIGAAVLVIAGVIGFPLVFETQPRPIALDIPIEIPRRDGAPPLAMPAPRVAAAPAAASKPVAAPRDDIVTESRADAGRDVAAASAPAVTTSTPRPASAAEPARRAAETKPVEAARPEAKPAEAKPAVAAADATRAQALLEGKDTKPGAKRDDAKEGGRFVVQVGAFADAAAAKEMRTKAEKLGLKTYTQVVDTASGSRTRVRLGPFASREEADKAQARAKEGGLNAVVLTL